VIGKLQNLTSLNLYGNQVTNIPLWMQSFSNLKELDLRGNPIPIEPAILGPKEPYISPGNLQTILSFYFQSQDPNQSAPLHEAKFIIVGEGAAGKTTLARRIQDPDCPMPPPEDRTEGIDVIRWQFQQPNGQPFYVNIWDFGGQEIYHATHQFFLTARSLYTLVIDNRRENPNLYYWLNIVCLLSDNSPIFIVKNEKQNCKFSIDEPTLRKEFDRLVPSLPADFAINRGLPEILKVIQTNLLNLPHISNPIPNSYIRIRNVLENFSRSQNYISAEEYYKICCSQNIKDRQEQLNISKYLHELGICLHFQEHSSLKHLLILNPAWATNAVYQISNYEVNETKVVLANQGRFTRADLKNIWHRSEYANMHDELLELMQKFEICYPILNLPDTYIAPSLLPEDRPEYQWNTNDNLILRYQYEFMPKGIVTRFIVETHDLIETPDATKPENQLVWQKGVILSDRYARAEIIEDYIKKEIRIRVAGLQRKSLLAIIRRDFKKIHDSFKGSFNQLDYQEMIPCDCPTCDRTQDPYAYPLDELLSFIADKDWEIQCRRKGRNMVDVRRLLNEFSIDDEELDRKNLTPTTITPNPPNTYINNNIIIDQPARTSSPKKPPMNNKKIIRIVVASPGDVQTERDILADKVIPELNKGIAKSHNLLLEIDRWETDTHPGFHIDGPQGLIDEILEIDRCDILIGIFWKRFGSPIKSGETGTEHEFMTAYQAWQQQGTPEIMMYFKEKDFLPTKQDLAQYTKVLDFKENFPAEGLYWKFQDEDSFERTIRQHLTRVVSNLASS
jgi:internalin A